MDLATIQPFGICASVIAVVVSVIALSFQVRMNTRSLRSYGHSRALDRLAAVQSRLAADSALPKDVWQRWQQYLEGRPGNAP
jgi:hypothetical protein